MAIHYERYKKFSRRNRVKQFIMQQMWACILHFPCADMNWQFKAYRRMKETFLLLEVGISRTYSSPGI